MADIDASDAWSMCSDMSYQSLSDIDYFSRNFDLNNGSPINNENFNVIHYNINSITCPGRIEELTYICRLLSIDVLVCTESKLDHTIPTNLITIPKMHEPIRKDRNRHGGGTLMWISEKLAFKHRPELEEGIFEHIWADIKINNITFSVNAFYRPPSDLIQDENVFLETSERILLKLHNLPNPIIASDLNFGNCYSKYPLLLPKSLDDRAPDLFENYGMCQLIDIPTRVTDSTTSLIDLFFVKNKDLVLCHGTLPKIADHDGILCSFNVIKSKEQVRTKTIYDFQNVELVGLLTFIKEHNFENNVFNHPVEIQAELFTNVMIEAMDKFIPKRTITLRASDQSWCNSFTRLLLRKKNRNYLFFKKANSKYLNAKNKNLSIETITRLRIEKENAHKKSRKAANDSTSGIKRTKANFFNTVNNTMKNSNISAKKKFSILLRLMKNSNFIHTTPLVENEQTINDPQEKSNIFNNFFTSKANVENPEEEPPNLEKLPGIESLSSINTSPIEVARILRQIKKSKTAYCGVPGIFLDYISTPVSFAMSKLFNNIFEAGIYPEIWKLAHVVPVFKKSGLKCDKVNFRPISILPTISKACEAVIHARLLAHCTENDIITERQAAYIKGDSTINQLLYIVNLIRTAWGQSNMVHGIFLDIDGAFDKIWHNGLLSKLNQIGIEESLLQLFASYLKGRKQTVVIDGVKSEVQDVKAGCPQGSKLGPLLFLIFINDMLKDIESEILFFADDTTLLSVGKNPEETAAMLTRDLEKIQTWSAMWKVTFKPSKSKDILFSKKQYTTEPSIIFNNICIERVSVIKHLGVIITSTLDWSEQINYVCLRANRKLSVLRSVKYLSRQTLDILYKLTVRSLIDYGLIIYYNNLTQKQKMRLGQIQYRAAKIVTGALHYSSQVKLEIELGWETLQTRSDFLGLTLLQKISIGQTRPLIKKCMPEYYYNPHDTRIKGYYRKYKYQGMQHKQSFFPFYSQLWNIIPERSENDFALFKTKLKERLKPKKLKFYSYGSKLGNTLITSLRVGRSYLNAHAYSIGLSSSPECDCGSKFENSQHILVSCPLYDSERQTMFGLVEQHISNFPTLGKKLKEDILLHGYKPENIDNFRKNCEITIAVQNFLLKTKRFIK